MMLEWQPDIYFQMSDSRNSRWTRAVSAFAAGVLKNVRTYQPTMDHLNNHIQGVLLEDHDVVRTCVARFEKTVRPVMTK